LFNPLPVRGPSLAQRVLGSLHAFDRINRRMHNKLLVADGHLALAGGRNVGDDYFMRGAVANFVDLDILCTGAVVGELAALFDRFWNDPLAYPVGNLAGGAAAAPAVAAAPAPPPTPFDGAGVAAQIVQGRLALHFADVRLLADAPDKVVRPDAPTRPGEAMAQALALMRAAHGEVAIASPYFVPGPIGMALLQEARDRGLEVRVLTNSLGATDEPLVHGGYRRYRRAMLELGVKLAELSPLHGAHDQGAGRYRSSLGRLHAKFAVVDRRWLLVGSMNMDRRSSRLNTEFALAIDNAALAAEALGLLQALWAGPNYQPRLAPATGRLEWLAYRGADPVVLDREPHVGPVDLWRLPLLSLFVPEELL
ncbi:MAG: phospholipase D family protein, partial [Burkholderiales bacterium]|nr:phospholipase D family protein [Burkholderiales bacterium]